MTDQDNINETTFSINAKIAQGASTSTISRLSNLNSLLIARYQSDNKLLDKVWLIPDSCILAWNYACNETNMPLEQVVYEIFAWINLQECNFESTCNEVIKLCSKALISIVNDDHIRAQELATRYMTSAIRSMLYSAKGISRTERYNKKSIKKGVKTIIICAESDSDEELDIFSENS